VKSNVGIASFITSYIIRVDSVAEQIGPGDLDTGPFLGLQDEEPVTWTPNVTKEVRSVLVNHNTLIMLMFSS
jgi:hypothetical protein